MGRYPSIAASKQKTGAARGKLYSMYAKEIYQVAKNGGSNPDGNLSLKRLIEKAKKDQVPNDIIKRAIDKVNSGVDESYENARYELFGPAGSTVIVDCLTDNVNRTISSIRTVLNKTKLKMGSVNSVSYMYDNLCIVGFKGLTLEETMDVLIENDIDVVDLEEENGIVMVYGDPSDLHKIKEAVLSYKEVTFEIDEIAMLSKDKVKLSGEDLDNFNKLLSMLDEVEDVDHVYHNVYLD